MSCVYFNCRNTKSLTKHKDINFFSFPVNADRCRQWLINSNRLDLLQVETKVMQSFGMCSEHFSSDHISRTVKGGSMFLNKEAVPFRYSEGAESDLHVVEEPPPPSESPPPPPRGVQNIVSVRNSRKRHPQQRTSQAAVAAEPVSVYAVDKDNSGEYNEEDVEDGSPSVKMRILELKVEEAEKETAAAQEKYLNALRKITKLQEQVKDSARKIHDLKLTLDEWREGALPEEILMKSIIPYLPPALKCLLHMQMRKGQGYNNEDRRFAIELHKVSPEAYEFLQTQAINLPLARELTRMEQRLNACKQDEQEEQEEQDGEGEESAAGNEGE